MLLCEQLCSLEADYDQEAQIGVPSCCELLVGKGRLVDLHLQS